MAAIQGTSIGAKIVPFDSADTYPTHEDSYGQGGYAVYTGITLSQFLNGAVTDDRKKIGQIIYLPTINKHYTFTTLNNPLSFYDAKPALPYEYVGSYLSTSFVAKTSAVEQQNTISSALGFVNGTNTWDREMFEHCSILGGSNNRFFKDVNAFWQGTNTNSTIVGGSGNRIDYASFSVIGGGNLNRLIHNHNVIAGGRENINYSFAAGFVGAGFRNYLGSNGQYSSIVGGSNNTISQGGVTQSNYSFIGGGESNLLGGDYSAIVAGKNNSLFGRYNFIGGGELNNAGGSGDVVLGGKNNLTSSSNIAELTLLTVSYSALQIDPKFVLDTYVRVFEAENIIAEFIPGARNTFAAQGAVRLFTLNDTIEGYTNPRVPALTLYSPTPTVSGRFGHLYYKTTFKSGTSGHLLISEPGANKVYLYRINYSNISQQPTLISTIIPPETIPLSAQFGISFSYIDNMGNGSFSSTEAYNLLFIGAPGVDKVYVYKNDLSLFNFSQNSQPFTYITELTGQQDSEFGYAMEYGCSFDGSYSTRYNHPSSIAIFIGAPNYNRAYYSPIERTGAIRLYVTQPDSSYTLSNRTFKPFYHAQDIISYHSLDNTNWWAISSVLPGDRLGSIIPGVYHDSPNGTNSNLSSFRFYVRASIPSASVKRWVKFGQNSGEIQFPENEYWLNSRNLTYEYTPFPGSISNIVSGGGVAYQYITNQTLTAYNQAPWEIQPTNMWSIFTDFSLSNNKVTIVGPDNTTTGIYSVSSFLSATNFQLEEIFNTTRTRNAQYDFINGRVREYQTKFACNNPRTQNNQTPANRYPGICYTTISDARGLVIYIPPYPLGLSLDTISNYGFQNFRTVSTDVKTGFSTIYYLSGNTLTYTNFAADLPGEGTSTNTILGGQSNTMRGKTSLIGGGVNNLIDTNVLRSAILAGGSNSITTTPGSLLNKNFNLIGTGLNNKIDNSDYSNILNGSDNTIQTNCVNANILGGTKNTILSGLSGVFVLGSALSGIKNDTTYVNNLFASDHIQAKTKSFTIKHPAKPGKTLTYGSLESPYHGIRLTGSNKVVNGICVVELPDYVNKLVKLSEINIQLTNYKHNKVLYVDSIDLSKNSFTVKTNSVLKNVFNYEFFWTFTAIRTDVPEIQVES